MALKPYAQGALDGLCAVYCVVNAARIVAGIKDAEARALFRRIILYLDKNRNLGNILTQGIGLTTIGLIFRDVVGSAINNAKMPYRNRPKTTLDEFWNAMSGFLNEDPKRALLIGLGGPVWNHWSIVHSISERQIHFFDSTKLKMLQRSRCTTIRSTSERPHVLHPTHTFFLS